MNGPGTVNNRTQVQVPLDQNETVYVDTPQPNVYNIALATLQTGTSVDVQKFLGGVPNQSLRVRASGLVTLKNNFGGVGSILLNTGADKLLDENRIYSFTYVDNVWVETADASGGGGGGGTTTNPLTIDDSNAGVTSPASFNGSSPITISANTVGAVALADFVSLGDAEWVQLDGAYADPAWITSLAYSKLTGAPSLSGYVVGPASATDNAIVRFDLATGKLVQNSGLFLSDSSIFTAATLSTASSVPITINATNSLLTLIGRGVTIKSGAIVPFKVRNPADTEDIFTVSDTVKIKSSTTPQLRIEDSLFYCTIGLTGPGQLEYNVASTNPLHSFLDPVKISGTNSGGPAVYILEVTGDGNTASSIIGISSLPFTAQSGTVTDLISAQLDIANTGIGDVTNAYGLVIEDIIIGTTINRAISTGLGDILFGTLAGVGTRMVTADASGVLSTASIPGGSSPVLTVPINAAATGNLTLTNQSVTEQFLGNSNRNITRYDLTGFTEARLIARIITGSASVNSPRIRVMYDLVSGGFSTTIGNYTSIASAGEVACSMTTVGVIDSGWVTLSATALNDCYLAVTQLGGDATADPALGTVTLYFR